MRTLQGLSHSPVDTVRSESLNSSTSRLSWSLKGIGFLQVGRNFPEAPVPSMPELCASGEEKCVWEMTPSEGAGNQKKGKDCLGLLWTAVVGGRDQTEHSVSSLLGRLCGCNLLISMRWLSSACQDHHYPRQSGCPNLPKGRSSFGSGGPVRCPRL